MRFVRRCHVFLGRLIVAGHRCASVVRHGVRTTTRLIAIVVVVVLLVVVCLTTASLRIVRRLRWIVLACSVVVFRAGLAVRAIASLLGLLVVGRGLVRVLARWVVVFVLVLAIIVRSLHRRVDGGTSAELLSVLLLGLQCRMLLSVNVLRIHVRGTSG